MKVSEFKYNLYQKISLIPIGMPGLIEEISLGVNGISYRVGYWNNGERYSVWVDESEVCTSPS